MGKTGKMGKMGSINELMAAAVAGAVSESIDRIGGEGRGDVSRKAWRVMWRPLGWPVNMSVSRGEERTGDQMGCGRLTTTALEKR